MISILKFVVQVSVSALCLAVVLGTMVLVSGCETAEVEESSVDNVQTDETVTVEQAKDEPVVYKDVDGDGYSNKIDCDDKNDNINPGMAETCNGIDDNCDGETDEGLTTKVYADGDKDGYGSELNASSVCSGGGFATNHYVSRAGDCNDSDTDNNADGKVDGYWINPGVAETCNNSIDDNCNGQVDEGCGRLVLEDALTGTGSILNLVVAFADPAPRTLSLVEYSSASTVGENWKTVASSTESVIKAKISSIDANCGVRFNVATGSPATKWLCEVVNGVPILDPEAKFYLELQGFEWLEVTGQVHTWSEAGIDGCSALLVITQKGKCNLLN